jgi:hypothetical protein
MNRNSLIIVIILLVFSSSSFAGLYKSSYDTRGNVIAAVEIEGKGIYNLVVSIQFLSQPYDKRDYTSDDYQELLNRLAVEWRGVALKTILETNQHKISDLPELKISVENELDHLIRNAKRKHGVREDVEVVYAISRFYLLEPNNE